MTRFAVFIFMYRIRISVVMFLLCVACANPTTLTPLASQIPGSPPQATATQASQPPTITPTAQPTDVWGTLLQSQPVAHDFPLPEPIASPLDGTYAKVDLSPPQWWTCYRCADYRPMGGIWRLQFDKGVMRILYEVTNWKSIASFTVSEDRVKIFNDPFCPHDVGEYEWVVKNGALSLTPITDGCAFDLRQENFGKQVWSLCKANNPVEGCSASPTAPQEQVVLNPRVTVTIHPGDSHYFSQPPQLFAAPNPENVASPEGITITYHSESIGYGTHRVLWSGGDWMEITTAKPFTSIGVQFWGSGYLGWARVLFHGEEVWRGSTTSIGKSLAYYGGYIEVSGFEPGPHTLRVESLSFDHRPIKVAAFGFSDQAVGK